MDPQPAPSSSSLFDDNSTKANENEIASYRSVSPMAVCSAILGVLSIIGLLHVSGYFLAALAIIAGLLALRKIRKYPGITTGQPYAHAGIALGVAFTLASVTYWQIVNYQLRSEVQVIAQLFTKALNTRGLVAPAYLGLPPSVREKFPMEELNKDMKKVRQSSVRLGDMLNVVEAMQSKLKASGDTIEYEGVQAADFHNLTAWGNVIYRVSPDGSRAMAMFRTPPEGGGRSQWYVETVVYPFVPKE